MTQDFDNMLNWRNELLDELNKTTKREWTQGSTTGYSHYTTINFDTDGNECDADDDNCDIYSAIEIRISDHNHNNNCDINGYFDLTQDEDGKADIKQIKFDLIELAIKCIRMAERKNPISL